MKRIEETLLTIHITPECLESRSGEGAIAEVCRRLSRAFFSQQDSDPLKKGEVYKVTLKRFRPVSEGQGD